MKWNVSNLQIHLKNVLNGDMIRLCLMKHCEVRSVLDISKQQYETF